VNIISKNELLKQEGDGKPFKRRLMHNRQPLYLQLQFYTYWFCSQL